MALRNIGSLWIGRPGGKAAFTGYLDGPNRTKGAKVLILPNDKATPENRQPQFRIVVEEVDAEPKPTPRGGDDFQVSDDEVPF